MDYLRDSIIAGTLDNGIEYFLINVPGTGKASVSINTGTGSFSENSMPGALGGISNLVNQMVTAGIYPSIKSTLTNYQTYTHRLNS